MFRIEEESEDREQQRDIDRFHIQKILSDLNLEHLQHDYVHCTRLGRKEVTKIRPIRFQFRNNWVRERIVNKAWMLKFSLVYCGAKFPQGVSLARDLTKDDREKEKARYLNKRQQNSATGISVSRAIPGATEVGDRAQTNEQSNRPTTVTTDHLPPQGVREAVGT